MQDPYLWEILVPCIWNNLKPVRTRHHREWDKYVRRITGGLTIYKPAVGQWIDDATNDLYAERVIPVRIYCTKDQIIEIANFTLRHYKQLAVMTYVVSENVMIIKANDKIRKDKTVAGADQCIKSDGGVVSGKSDGDTIDRA